MLNSLDSVINNGVKLRHTNGSILLEEPSEDARLREIKLKLTSFLKESGGSIRNAIVIKSDLETSPYEKFSYYLSDDCEHINKRCDYIIFHLLDNEIRIILCELKSSHISLQEGARCHAQLDISMEFAKYLVGIGDKYHKLTGLGTAVDTTYSFHKVVFLPTPNVVLSAPLATKPVLNVRKDKNGIFVIPVNTCPKSKAAEINWRDLMSSIN